MRLETMVAVGIICSALPLTVTQAATELQGRLYEPSSPWVLDYADERCTLARNFGNVNDTILLRIDSFGSWSNFHLTIAGRALPRLSTPARPGGYRLTGDSESRDARLLFGTLGADKTAAVSLDIYFAPFVGRRDWERMSDNEKDADRKRIASMLPEFERKVDTIRVSLGRGSPVELHVGSMAEPLAAMRTCIADLYKSWGMDPELEHSLSRHARPIPTTVKHVQRDYPGAALMQGLSAYVPVRLMIDSSGKATSCVVQSPEAGEDFKQAVCDNLSGKFEPALDADGHPVASMFNTSVVYLVGWPG